MINFKKISAILIAGAVLNGGFYIYFEKIALAGLSEKSITDEAYQNYLQKRGAPVPDELGSLTLTARQGEDMIELSIPKEMLKEWIKKSFRSHTNKEEPRLDIGLVESYLKSMESEVNSKPVDAKLEFSEKQNKIRAFSVHKSGYKLKIGESVENILAGIKQGKNKIHLASEIIEPKITIDSIENLGINAFLAKGESDFAGSSDSRIHNIKTASVIYHGVLISPGEIFSFNQLLGAVDARTGYKYEMVIKNGKLIPEYGGGVCQVSTTIFRAALNAGLPIVERRAHSLPVRYYNPQGLDATIYPGVVDFKFQNDTQGYVLVQTRVDGTKLYFELYGSKDDRKVEISGPVQYDIKPDGSLKATLTRTVTLANGTQDKNVFYSSYKSPKLFEVERTPLE